MITIYFVVCFPPSFFFFSAALKSSDVHVHFEESIMLTAVDALERFLLLLFFIGQWRVIKLSGKTAILVSIAVAMLWIFHQITLDWYSHRSLIATPPVFRRSYTYPKLHLAGLSHFLHTDITVNNKMHQSFVSMFKCLSSGQLYSHNSHLLLYLNIIFSSTRVMLKLSQLHFVYQ